MRKEIPEIAIPDARWHASGASAPIYLADNRVLLGKNFKPTQLPMLVFAGYAARKAGLIRMLHGFAQEGHHVVIVDLPFNHKELRRKRNLVQQLAREGPHDAADKIREEYKEYKFASPIRALGHSKGASIVGRAMGEFHDGIGDAALVQSPELSRAADLSVNTREERKLIKDFVMDMISSPPVDHNFGELRAGGNVLLTFIQDMATRQFGHMVGPVVTGSIVENVLAHVQLGNTVYVTSTYRDKVFPALDTYNTLTTASHAATGNVLDNGRLLYYMEPESLHLNGDAPRGMRLLNQALGRLERNPGYTDGALQIYPSLLRPLNATLIT